MFTLVQKIFDAQFEFNAHDSARSFFLNLQNALKNTNFLPFGTSKYKEAMQEIEDKIHEKVTV